MPIVPVSFPKAQSDILNCLFSGLIKAFDTCNCNIPRLNTGNDLYFLLSHPLAPQTQTGYLLYTPRNTGKNGQK